MSSRWRASSKRPIFMPLDVQAPGPTGKSVRAHREGVGTAGFSRSFDRVFAQGDPARPRGRRPPRRLSDDDGCLLLVLHPHGASGRAADEERRDALHHDLLREPDGGGELQHHGRRQGGARMRRALHRGRSSAPKGIRVHAISPGPLATRAARAFPSSTNCWRRQRQRRRRAAWSASRTSGSPSRSWPMTRARLITGETLYVDGGYHIID